METLELTTLLYIALIIWVIMVGSGILFNARWLIGLSGILWLIPIIEIDNEFITVVSVIMFISHGAIALVENQNGGGFE